MRLARLCTVAALALPMTLAAQANPATEAAVQIGGRFSRLIQAAATEIPDSLLSYKPTDAQMTFGGIWAHLADANFGICSAIGGMAAPSRPHHDGTEAKSVLVADLQASFQFCDRAFAAMDDSKLGDHADLGFMQGTKATAMFIYIDDVADHYSQIAIYMRLNGMLPPSARRRQM